MRLDWIPIFTSIVDSSLWEEPPHVRLMFFTMMCMKDQDDHIVREPLRRISKVANLHEDKQEAYRLAEEAIKVLSSPDTKSPEKQAYEGRRIKWIEGQGWLVLNGEYYEKVRKELGARIRKTKLQRDRRERQARHVVSRVNGGKDIEQATKDERAERPVNERLDDEAPY